MSLHATAHAVAGATGGCLAFTLTYPLLSVSTRMQVHNRSKAKHVLYHGTLDALVSIVREEGWTALFSGLSTGLFGTALSQAIFYFVYSSVRTKLKDNKSTLLTDIVSPAIAGAFTCVLTNPLWVLNTRQLVKTQELGSEGSPAKRQTMASTAVSLYKESGVPGFFKGVLPALVLVVNPTVQYLTFERLVRLLRTVRGGKPSALQLFVLSALAKVVATVLTYPLITVKSRIQADNKNVANAPNSAQIILQLVQREGFGGLYKGLRSKMVQSVLNASFLFLFQNQISRVVLIAFMVLQMWKNGQLS